jgi:hypothetical protein
MHFLLETGKQQLHSGLSVNALYLKRRDAFHGVVLN